MTRTGYIRDNGHQERVNQRRKKLLEVGCETIIIEKLHSIDDSTPKLDEYLSSIEENDCLVVCDRPSLSRNISVVASTLNKIKAKNAKLEFLDIATNFSSAENEFTIRVLAARNELEDAKLAEETR